MQPRFIPSVQSAAPLANPLALCQPGLMEHEWVKNSHARDWQYVAADRRTLPLPVQQLHSTQIVQTYLVRKQALQPQSAPTVTDGMHHFHTTKMGSKILEAREPAAQMAVGHES